MRVLFYSHSSNVGNGAVESLSDLLAYLRCHHECVVVVAKKGSFLQRLEAMKIPVIVAPFNWISRRENTFDFLLSIQFLKLVKRWLVALFLHKKHLKRHIRIVRFYNPDVIYSNSSVIHIGICVAKKLNIRHIWHLREFQNLDYNLNPDFGWNYYAQFLSSSSVIIANSNATKTFYSRFTNAAKINVVYNGCRIDDVMVKREENIVGHRFLMVGNINSNKGFFSVIKVINRLRSKFPSVKLDIVGQGPDLDKLISFVDENNLSQTVKFCGHVNDADLIYNHADCFIMGSKHEAFGRVTIEAMSRGIPVIGYDGAFTATGEIIKDGENGFLYRSDAELLDVMGEVVGGRYDLKLIAANARNTILDKFAINCYFKNIDDLISDFNIK